MKQRIITSLLIIALVVPPLILGGYFFRLLIFVTCAIAGHEIVSMMDKNSDWPLTLLVYLGILLMYNIPDKFYIPGLILFLIGLFVCLFFMKSFEVNDLTYIFVIVLILTMACKGAILIYELNPFLLVYLIIACYTTDIFAYFVGLKFGKHKLIPKISPNKTVEGSIGGYIFSVVISFIFGISFVTSLPINILLFYSLTLGILAQIGDLAFSSIKRHYNIKDYGSLFPGHGGILDRIDSLLFCIIYFYAFLVIFI